MKINLVEQIKKDLPFLGVEIPKEKTAKAFTFFLNQDIEKIFGKVEFESFENGKEIEYEKVAGEDYNFIAITIPMATLEGVKQKKYIIKQYAQCCFESGIVCMDDSIYCLQRPFKIEISANEESTLNELTINADSEMTITEEIRNIKKQCVFTYQVNDAPVISATPINVKTGEYSYYEIIKGMKKASPSFLKSIADTFANKNICKIRTGYGLTDDFDYLEEIFAILESETRNEEQKLTRNKED